VQRALAVFVRFRDDTTTFVGCTEKARQWRHPDQLPDFADYVFDSDNVRPFDRRSLTDYFYMQSNGKLVVLGESFHRVIVSNHDAQSYVYTAAKELDLELLSREIMTALNDDPSVNLSDFDADENGVIDFVYIVLRRQMGTKLTTSGASGIAHLGYNSGPVYGADPTSLKQIVDYRSGAYIKYNNAGNIFPDLNLFRLMAHEFLHGLFPPGREVGIMGHIAVDRDRPGVGYHLMAAHENRGGSQTLSAFERDNWGWIDCLSVSRDTTLKVKDLYTGASSNCVKLRLRDHDTSYFRLYLSNHQRIGSFDTLRSEDCYGERSDHGLMTTGLLATRVTKHRSVAMITADDDINLGLTTKTYDGDMFGPQSPQLTPWTTPNIHGYSRYPTGRVLSDGDFVAIDNIRYDEVDPTVMVIDYRADFRDNPTFRSDSRIGPESRGITLSGVADVMNKSRLEIATDVRSAGTLVVRSGSSLLLSEGSTLAVNELHVEAGAVLVIKGVLSVEDLYGDSDMLKASGGKVFISHTHVSSQDGDSLDEAPHLYNSPASDRTDADLKPSVYPNPFSTTLVVEFTTDWNVTVDVEVFDVLGRRVAKLARSARSAADHYRLTWSPRDLARGTYYVRVVTGDRMEVVPVTYTP
jgi:M6 family metalloprotease-like protein